MILNVFPHIFAFKIGCLWIRDGWDTAGGGVTLKTSSLRGLAVAKNLQSIR